MQLASAAQSDANWVDSAQANAARVNAAQANAAQANATQANAAHVLAASNPIGEDHASNPQDAAGRLAQAATDAATPLSGSAATISGESISDQELRSKYRQLTKQILLKAIQLGRFSLLYRLYGTKRWEAIGLQYVGTQEAGAVGTMALNIVGMREFYKGRHDPEKINLHKIRNAAKAAMVTQIIASSGSAVALGYNAYLRTRNHRRNLDTGHARQYVAKRLQEIDRLLAERDAFTQAHADHPLASLALEEGRILHLMRDAFVVEFATFLHDVHRLRVDENLFYVLNAAANVLVAISSHYVDASTHDYRLNAPAQILLTVSGAVATVSPLISTATGIAVGRREQNLFTSQVGGMPVEPGAKLVTQVQRAQAMLDQVTAAGYQLPAGLTRVALYLRSSHNFVEELQREQRIMKYLNSVATQNDVVGPAIGGTSLAQGILGIYGHYKYVGVDEKKKAGFDYAGSVVGTVGSAVAVGVTAGALIFDLWYMRRLEKQQKLPEQLIEERLKNMEETEKLLSQMD